MKIQRITGCRSLDTMSTKYVATVKNGLEARIWASKYLLDDEYMIGNYHDPDTYSVFNLKDRSEKVEDILKHPYIVAIKTREEYHEF